MEGAIEEETGEEEFIEGEATAETGGAQAAATRALPGEGGRDMDKVKRIAALYA